MKKTVLLLLCVLLLLPLYGCDQNDEPEWEKKVDSIEGVMTYDELVALLGEPVGSFGSGITYYVFLLPEKHVTVVSPDLNYTQGDHPVVFTYDEYREHYGGYPNDPDLLSDYQYTCSDGQYEIVLDSYSSTLGPKLYDAVYFDSFDEMINDIRSGSFTKKEMMQIYHFHKDFGKPIPVCDLDSLYMPVLPDGLPYRIAWEGDTYYCDIETEQFHIRCSFPTDEEWQEYLDIKNLELVSTEEDTGAKVYLESRSYWYDTYYRVRDISVGEGMLQIVEYFHDYPQKRLLYWVMAEQNGIRYMIKFWDMKEEPSTEFIRQLGIAGYINE